MTHLDTSYLIDLLREIARVEEGPASAVLDRLADEELAVSVHVLCELHAGAELSRDPDGEHPRVGELTRPLALSVPSEGFAPEYARLLAELRRRGETISTMDLLIATGALVDGADLVTRNARDFERVPGLRVISY